MYEYPRRTSDVWSVLRTGFHLCGSHPKGLALDLRQQGGRQLAGRPFLCPSLLDAVQFGKGPMQLHSALAVSQKHAETNDFALALPLVEALPRVRTSSRSLRQQLFMLNSL